jgi:hypothetical protein
MSGACWAQVFFLTPNGGVTIRPERAGGQQLCLARRSHQNQLDIFAGWPQIVGRHSVLKSSKGNGL